MNKTMRKLRQTIPFCFIWITIFFFSCHKSSVDINLKDSKSNRHELEKLIQHYKGDELKLEAVKFLLENIDIHGCYRSSASDSLFQYMIPNKEIQVMKEDVLRILMSDYLQQRTNLLPFP